MRGVVPFLAFLLFVATASAAFAQIRITELPDGNILIEISGPGGGGAVAVPGSESVRPPSPGQDGASPSPSDPAARATFLEAEIRRIERERDFLNVESPGDPVEADRHRIEVIRKVQEVNRLKAELRRVQAKAAPGGTP